VRVQSDWARACRRRSAYCDSALQNDELNAPRALSLLEMLDQADAGVDGGARTDDADDEAARVHSFEVRRDDINKVRHRCVLLDCPTLEEYDFRQDRTTDSL
jgi:hypothetical protein